MRRREFVKTLSLAGLSSAVAPFALTAKVDAPKGRLKQSVMRVNFDPKMSMDDMCREAARIGFAGYDAAPPADWPTLKKYGLVPTLGGTGPVNFEDGIIRKEIHDKLEAGMIPWVDQCAAAGCPGILVVGWQRKEMPYEEAADNAVAFFNRVKGHAEDKGVDFYFEIMNNKFKDPVIGRWDQVFNHLDWGIDVVKRVNSPRVKVLFDIYHVQTMDGDVIHHIRDNFQWIGHFHTGGVPNRNELDDTQELNYHLIAKTIADLGYTGYIAHEYHPSAGKDPIKDLEQAFQILAV
jgi:hydroxypyruvate isomerase